MNINTKSQKPQSMHHLLESKRKEFGDRPFIWDKWHSDDFVPHSYNDLINDAQIFANYLLVAGHKNGNIILFSENSYYWYVCNMAITAYVGISVAANKDWQSYDMKNALKTIDAKVIIYSAKNAPVIDELRALYPKKIFLSTDKIADIISSRRQQAEDVNSKLLEKNAQKPEKLCQIIFTTGSSGLPKAVPISFDNMEVCLQMMLSRLPFSSSDTHYLFLPLSHVFGNMAALVSFRQGHKLYLCSDTKLVKDEIKIAKPTIVCGVPLFFDRIFDGLDKKSIETINSFAKITTPLSRIGINLRKILFKKLYKAFGGQLKYIICGAAPLRPEIKQLFLNVGIDFVEAYGMSETCAFITMEKRGHQIANSVGNPYAAVECKLIDKDKSGIGEVIVKGPNVFKGYFKTDKIEKLALDNNGFFHTGDLGRFDKQGRLFLTGRKKRLILTSNGENVSPDELEKLLSDQIKAKKIKVFATDEGITATIFPLDDDGRADDEFKKIVHNINESLPKFKHIKTTNINRNSEMSVK